MIRHDIYLNPDQKKPITLDGYIRCPSCGKILGQMLALNSRSIMALYCRRCKLHWVVKSSRDDNIVR